MLKKGIANIVKLLNRTLTLLIFLQKHVVNISEFRDTDF